MGERSIGHVRVVYARLGRVGKRINRRRIVIDPKGNALV